MTNSLSSFCCVRKFLGCCLFVAVILALTHPCLGATITAASTSVSDVQAAINSASDGDTVVVPSGSATWSKAVTISKGITLVGGGNGSGTTTITQGGSAGTQVLNVSLANKSCTVKNFKWVEVNVDSVTSSFIQFSGSFFRFCSNTVVCTSGLTVSGTDTGHGLIDNNNFTFGNGNCVNIFGSGDGSAAWNHGTTYGTTNYLYIEHNTFTSTDSTIYMPDGVIDCYAGAKFVLRYNTMTNCVWGWHGCDSGSYRSTHSYEIYGNHDTFTGSNPPYWGDVFNSRGGTGLIFSNTITGWLAGGQGHVGFLMQYYRLITTYTPWGKQTGSNPYDGNTDSSGYPGIDQQGRTGPTVFYSDHSTQVLSPTYIWGNNGLSYGSDNSNVQLNRDYFTSAPPFSYTPLADPYPLGGESQVIATNPPQIDTQPNDATVMVGQAATFNVTASGSGTLTYQWCWYGTNVTGATSSTWTTPSTVLGNSNSVVYVKVANANGNVVSSNARLYVTNGVGPSIASSPVSRTNSVGDSTTFSVVANGSGPLAYQWRLNSAPINGANNSSYTIAPVQTNNAGSYSVVVSNTYGTAVSAPATLAVTAATQTVHYYYVAPNGSDSANGSIGSPWATLEHAASVMKGGDVLYVRGGTYGEIFDLYGPNGSASYPTIIQAYPGETPIFNNKNISGGAHSLNGLNWFVVSGLTVMSNNVGMIVGYAGACSNLVLTNMTFTDIGQQGLQIAYNSHDVLVVNSKINHTGLYIYNGEGVYIGQGDSQGITDNTHNVTIRGCEIHDTKDEAVEVKPGTYSVTVENNTIYTANKAQGSYGLGGGAIEVDEEGTYNKYNNNPNHVIRGNLVYDTPIGIRAGNGGQFYNNVVYSVTQNGILANSNDGDSYTRYIYNNTVDASSSIAIVNNGATTSILNNIGRSGSYNLTMSNAYFVNRGAHDYHLVAGGAPIGAGSNLYGVVTTDFDGNPRPATGAFDIGAFQFVSPAIPLPPTDLRVESGGASTNN